MAVFHYTFALPSNKLPRQLVRERRARRRELFRTTYATSGAGVRAKQRNHIKRAKRH